MDYYQVIPAADADLAGTAAICRDLRTAAKNSLFRTDARQIGDFIQTKLNDRLHGIIRGRPYAQFVDIAGLFAGHEMCTVSPWEFDGGFSNTAHWRAAHPNATGQALIAAAVVNSCASLPKRCLGR